MGLQFTVAPKQQSTHDNYVRAHYNTIKRRWYAVFGKESHPIDKVSLEISGVKILYSLPENDKHKAGTKREVTTIENPFEVSKFWSVLCEGIAIAGKPNKKDNTYTLTHILHDNIKEPKHEKL
jgi:hypothetical protein